MQEHSQPQEADTIIALSTATPAALGILRLSGSQAITAVSALFCPRSGKNFAQEDSRKLVYGTLVDGQGREIDHVLATYSKAPHSYTGEDTAEVHCHGSPMVLTLALEAFYAQGCRQATAGEFTQRSFLNGKLDLLQAEGVADLIDAKTPAAVYLAAGQLQGRLTAKIQEIYQAFTHLMAHFCVVLDYPDEDIDPFTRQEMEQVISAQAKEISDLESTWERGKAIARGIPVVILGLPNGGKSSLLNALLGYGRAIVSPIAGTTRDTVEGEINCGAQCLRLIDTAGLRETSDPIEQMGVERSLQAKEEAQLQLIVIDSSSPLTGEEPVEEEGIFTICVLNKMDKEQVVHKEDLHYRHICEISAMEKQGLTELMDMISQLFIPKSKEEEVLISNLRQVEQLRLAGSYVAGALEGLQAGMSADCILSDVEGAMWELGKLTGQNVGEDITQEIFSRFCVGK